MIKTHRRTGIRKLNTRIMSALLAVTMIFTMMPILGGNGDAQAATNLYKSYAATVQSYTAKTGTFKLTSKSRFYIVSEAKPAAAIVNSVKLVEREFAAGKRPSSTPLAIVYGPEEGSKTGDILIKVLPGKYGKEAYRMTVGAKTIIAASTTDGVFRGLRSFLKYRIATGSNTLKACYVSDYPDVAERTVHLDCARKYFSPTWIKNFIKRSSWQGYNAIEIHFSEDQGLRLASKKYPWLAGSYNSSKGVLTQSQMADIIKCANNYHMEVIPSFDSPGHLNYITKKYANYVSSHSNFSFTYNGRTYNRKSSGFRNISNYFKYKGKKTGPNYLGINIASGTARAFINSLIDEYADFFREQGCTKFNIGGDELLGWSTVRLAGKTFGQDGKWNALQHWDSYAKNTLKITNGNATDTFAWYMNTIATRLEKKGFTCRMWNDEIHRFSRQHIRLKPSVQVVYWSNNYRPLSYLEKRGYKMYNAVSPWCYYVIGVDYKYVKSDYIYKNYRPKNFGNPKKSAKFINKSQYGGAYFCIWCDYATKKSAATVWSDTRRLTWASSAKMWNTGVNTTKSGSGKALSYDAFKAYFARLGTFPGYSGAPGKSSTLPSAKSLVQIILPPVEPETPKQPDNSENGETMVIPDNTDNSENNEYSPATEV